MYRFTIQSLRELGTLAAAIGRNEGRDFSFVAVLNGKAVRATCRHIERPGQPVLGDIIPASRYGVTHA